MAKTLRDVDWDKLREELHGGIREAFAQAFDFVSTLDVRLLRQARRRHLPFDVSGGGGGAADPLCIWCKTAWPCQESVRLDAEIASRSGE